MVAQASACRVGNRAGGLAAFFKRL